jgi:hypothetical protein
MPHCSRKPESSAAMLLQCDSQASSTRFSFSYRRRVSKAHACRVTSEDSWKGRIRYTDSKSLMGRRQNATGAKVARVQLSLEHSMRYLLTHLGHMHAAHP